MSLIRQCLTAQGPKKTILVLDGGGARGGFALEIMRLIAHAQPLALSKLFSMIFGVSAGAIVGTIVALGLLDDVKTVDEVCESFVANVPKMFTRANKNGPLFRPKYDGTGKTATLKRILGTKTFADVKTPLVVVCSTTEGAPVLFRSWEPENQDVLLADVLDATSAVPTYFPPVMVKNTWLIDGGVRANKPLIVALLTSIKYFDQQNLQFFSIGTLFASTRKFVASKAQVMGVLGWLANGLIEVLLGVQDHTSEELMKELFGSRFLRLECMCEDIRLDDVTEQRQARLINAATMVWKQQSSQIISFLLDST